MILLKSTYPVVFKEYVVPKSSLTRSLRKTYPLIQSRNLNDLQKIFEVGGVLWVNFIEIVKLSVQMKKSGRQTYLNEDEKSLVFVSACIEGCNGLPFYLCGIS